MLTSEIRRRYLEYFGSRNHEVVPSASLISADPSLLFTVAGMVPFIPYMLGQVTPPWPRATSVQKCVRTLDIDEVGKTTRHGTFFQMNGNFSFGDYFKEGAIAYAWELVTGPQSDGFFGFDPDSIWVTVYEGDDEAARLWRSVAGLAPERIQRRGMKDNFWSTGQPGPAGPCSEIYVDRGPQFGPDGGPIVDEDRFLEIWNLVFMEMERGRGTGKEDFEILGELAQKNIDTGMGLERVAYLLQGAGNLYEIDEVFPVIAKAEELAGRTYGSDPQADVGFRVVADHVRSALMLIGDGVTPSNEGRGYVLRRLVRRVIRSMRLLGVYEHVMPELLTTSKDAMKASYPELQRDWDRISGTAYAEEDSFLRTLTQGTAMLTRATARARDAGQATLSGDDAFALHDTFGFPIDLTIEAAAEQGLDVDVPVFRELMAAQRQRARADALAKRVGLADTGAYQAVLTEIGRQTEFDGYSLMELRSRIVGLLADGVAVPVVSGPADVELILDRTPFYAEAGGQQPDQGTLEFDSGATVDVDDVQRPVRGLIVHRGRLAEGTLAIGDAAHARVDVARRKAISRAHTATHMVHRVLRDHLGGTATQAGSENAPSRLRFDFHYGSSVPASSLAAIEEEANTMLAEDLEVTEQVMPRTEAEALGAMALFGEKYGDMVRVVSIGGDWSRELCGGTHMNTSGQLGRITLVGEESTGSGVRRLEAFVGDRAYGYNAREHVLVSQLSELLKVRADDLPQRVDALVRRVHEAERRVDAMRQARLLARAADIAAGASGDPVLLATFDAGEDGAIEDLRALAGDVRARLGEGRPTVVAMAGQAGGRAVIVVATNGAARDRGVRAGVLAKAASGVLGGGGGGKDDMAQGGGARPDRMAEAFAVLRQEVAD